MELELFCRFLRTVIAREWIGDPVVFLHNGCWRQDSWVRLCHGENVADGHVIKQKIIGDDPPVTAPPENFRTHQRNRCRVSQCNQLFKTAMKILSLSLISVIMKTLHSPVSVGFNRHR